jgi:hypothetical protein
VTRHPSGISAGLIQLGASSGIGAQITGSYVESEAKSASDIALFGAGYGGSASVFGSDRSFSKTKYGYVQTVSYNAGANLEISPEFGGLPGEIHAYGSFTIDFNDLVGVAMDAIP